MKGRDLGLSGERLIQTFIMHLGLLVWLPMARFGTLMPFQQGFQVQAGKIGPAHAYVRIEETGIPVNIFGMNVQHNDLIHADRHGAVVIPKELTEELPKAIDLMIRKEKIILDACKREDFDFEILKKVIQDSALIR